MRSRNQEVAMLKKTALILSLLPITSSIKEINERTGISTSSIQRYLNNEELIKKILKITNSKDSYEELSLKIKEWLNKSKKEGNRHGGQTSQNLYSFSKNEEGKFFGTGKNRR